MIEVSDLHLEFQTEAGPLPILRGLNLRIENGEKVAICGPSGSGKSTLLYILGGLLRPSSGQVLLDGQDIWSLTESQRSEMRARRIGFVFQQFHLIPGWSVRQNILLPTEYNFLPNAEDRAQTLIQQLGLQGLEDRKPNQLSGGQAQRVAIGRALLMNPGLVLADEPTGSLDSKTTQEILGVFDRIHQQGHSVILITHDETIAAQCERVLRIEDGHIVSDTRNPKQTSKRSAAAPVPPPAPKLSRRSRRFEWPGSFDLLRRNPSRSLLTLFGIAVGVAAVIAMISISRFAREKIIASYSELGVRNFQLWGYPDWSLRLRNPGQSSFQQFNIERDIKPLLRVFPEIRSFSPSLRFWASEVSHGGRTVTQDVNLMGFGAQGLRLNEYNVQEGRGITEIDVEERTPVCVVGNALAHDLRLPKGETPMIFVKTQRLTFACRVVGRLGRAKSIGGRWSKPGYEVILPYTYMMAVNGENPYSNEGDLNQILFEVQEGLKPSAVTGRVKKYFEQKYAPAAMFNVDTNSKIVGQMEKFLDIFSTLLTSIAFITLLVGATGVTNMILVSISERVRELGIRRAVGAEPRDLRRLVLSESLTLCSLAGLLGIIAAFSFEHLVLYAASKVFPKIPFEWLLDPWALSISLISILGVGIGAGLYPALKVERQDVVQALRSE